MSKQDAYDEFIAPMKRVFSPPPHLPIGGQDEALREYVDALSRFNASELQTAWQRIRDRHRKAFWPPIAECVASAAESKRNSVEATPKDKQLYGRVIDGQYQPWGGACNCSFCARQKAYRSAERISYAPANS